MARLRTALTLWAAAAFLALAASEPGVPISRQPMAARKAPQDAMGPHTASGVWAWPRAGNSHLSLQRALPISDVSHASADL